MDSEIAPIKRRKGTKRQGRPPGSDREATRRRIMDAAQLCFGEYGYRETSNRVIADLAHVTTGTIYHYFASKRNLFLAVHEQTQADITARLRPVVESDLTLTEALEAVFRIMLTIYVERPNYHKFNAVVRTEALRNPEIASARTDNEWRALYRDFAERGVRNGEVDKSDTRTLRVVLGSIILGLAHHGMEASVADHRDCLRGMGLLFSGQLVHDPDN